MGLQEMINAISETASRERGNYHLTLGGLIDKLKTADPSSVLSPKIAGIGAYRGYYSDIALCTDSGNSAYREAMDYDNMPKDFDAWDKKNRVEIDFTGTPQELAAKLESLLGLYFDGYKGGYNEITREKPLWIASDYGDCSQVAVIGISDTLELITKIVE